jgi:hypothetical protein
VVIRTRFEPGTLKVGEVVVPGGQPESFVLVAHLCHPAMVNDDLTGVVVGLEAMRRLLDGFPDRQPDYTYRLLILPETIGSVAYLSHNEPDPCHGRRAVPGDAGQRPPHALQGSFMPCSQPDRCLVSALASLDPTATAPLPHGDQQRRAPVQRPRRARADALALARRAARLAHLALPRIPLQPRYPCHRHPERLEASRRIWCWA